MNEQQWADNEKRWMERIERKPEAVGIFWFVLYLFYRMVTKE